MPNSRVSVVKPEQLGGNQKLFEETRAFMRIEQAQRQSSLVGARMISGICAL
jgi:hypothetical protein